MIKDDQRGIVGIALLGLVLAATIVGAGFYVYNARSTGTSVDAATTGGVKPKPAKEVKADADAAAADSAARAAEMEDLNDVGVTNNDF
jgi:hypothetical protein